MTKLFVPRSPHLKRKLLRLAERGAVVRLYPGIYCDPGLATSTEARIHGAALWSRDGVLLGAAAAGITFWPDVAVPIVSIGVSSDRVPPPGIRLHRGRIPPDLIMERQGLRCTVPALTALDLGANGIDEALRRGAATLDQLHQAMAATPHRYGNRERRLLLHDSRDSPWSEAERLLHQRLRGAKITGWRTNVEVWCGSQQYFIDAAFVRLLLGIEVDGYAVHGQRGQFERDRQKWSDLTAAGWTLLHFTWHQLTERPDWVIETIQQSLRRVSRLGH